MLEDHYFKVLIIFLVGGILKVKNDGSLFPKIDFCVKGCGMSHGLDEDGQEIFSAPYIFTRGKRVSLNLITRGNTCHSLGLNK